MELEFKFIKITNMRLCLNKLSLDKKNVNSIIKNLIVV